ncbi:MAG: hypothetical protein J0H00_11260 [Burkholderiales bacterium]|nr:hypothetical protein [Burkholderiales bacterium]OJX08137.1 MAG: hypothetical protein BGO72_01165 [Burkholderiales bacterium 70-64]
MSLGFRIDVAPTRGLRLIQRALVAFAAAGFALAGALAAGGSGAALALAGLASCWLAWRAGVRGLSWGQLAVDEAGRAAWRGAGSGEPGSPVEVERWHAGQALVWLRLREAGQRRARHVLLLRAACGGEPWRRLRAWLVWLGRGPAPRA